MIVVITLAAALVVAWVLQPPAEFADRLAKLEESETVINNAYYNMPEWAETFRFRNGTQFGSLFVLNAVRVPYFERIWVRELGGKAGAFLDVGCGGGVATNALAELGFELQGVDVAQNALQQARTEAEAMNVTVRYTVGSCYELPVADGSQDGVVMSDVLEHLHDLKSAVAEVYRVLKPGGVFVLDTINRTFLSWVALILLSERLTGFVPPGTHDWRMFITPDELHTLLSHAGFTVGPPSDLLGFAPQHPLSFSNKPNFVITPDDTRASFLWWAQKPRP